MKYACGLRMSGLAWVVAAGLVLAVEGATAPARPAARATGREALAARSADPYLGAIVVDAATGQTLFEDHADAAGYPASCIKLMDMLVIQNRVEKGQVKVGDMVTITAEAARTGGSQVYLAEKEVFSVEDLLYALMVQSANDAAVALALHVAGTKEGFVELMNGRAAELGMTNTHFHSVHGLPPAEGQQPDVSTPRDLALLARELVKHPDVLRYSSTRERPLRGGKFVMRNHNHLLGEIPGCDGFKTGYIKAGGYSIVATAERGGRRVIAIVLGSKDRLVRDAKAKALLSKGFMELPPLPPPSPAVTNIGMTNALSQPVEPVEPPRKGGATWSFVAAIAVGAAVVGAGGFWAVKRFHGQDL